jgi:hypothetical protein
MNEGHRVEAGDESPGTSGKWVVLGLLVFGCLFIGVLSFYTVLHTGPFQELRNAIDSEFLDSSPQVEGGQRKIHKGSPKILRITLQVHDDPRDDDQRVGEMVDRLVSLAETHHGLGGYDILDVYLVWFRPEHKAVSRHEEREVRLLIETGQVTPIGG